MESAVDYKVYYENIKEKFPILNEDVKLHQWPDKASITSRIPAHKLKMGRYTSKIVAINPSAITLLEACDGLQTTQQIIETIKENEQIQDDLFYEKIVRFLYTANNDYSHIHFSSTKAEEKMILPHTGSKEFYFPTHLVIEPTNDCNLHCKHCYRLSGKYEKQELSLEEIRNVIDQMYNMGSHVIEITGGECTLYKNFTEVIEYAYPKNNIIAVLSNGIEISEDIVKKLNKFRDKLYWSISLDSCNEKYHDNFRGFEGAFKKTCEGIRNLVQNNHFVKVSMAITPENLDQIKDTIDFVHDNLKADMFGFSSILPVGRGANLNNIGFTTEEALKIVDARRYANKYTNFVYLFNEDKFKNTVEHSKNCGVGWRSIVVGPNGNVRPCVMIDEEMITLGNIRKEKIEDIVKKDTVTRLHDIEMPTEKYCTSCKDMYFCKGCIHRALTVNVEKIENKEPQCNWAEKNRILDYIENIHISTCVNKSCGL